MSYKLLIVSIKLDVKSYRDKTNSITIIRLYFSHLGAKAVILYRISDFFIEIIKSQLQK